METRHGQLLRTRRLSSSKRSQPKLPNTEEDSWSNTKLHLSPSSFAATRSPQSARVFQSFPVVDKGEGLAHGLRRGSLSRKVVQLITKVGASIFFGLNKMPI
ncbi:hypothetical protein Bca52824_031782 [Brassica carinata]|uniref:Uncharacterized protein n=1 Tax=Brassica carinata TaxID=52824 RepID=A0A8X7SB73_BRACI|nr:hypothetical protein Bca52824_031782 [Brassica carinata]